MTSASVRNRLTAPLLAAATIGLGHLYLGKPRVSVALLVGYHVTSLFVVVLALLLSVDPITALLIGFAWGRFVWFAQIWVAARAVDPTRIRRSYNRASAYVAYLIVAQLSGAIIFFGLFRPLVIDSYRVPTDSMFPAIRRGDGFLAVRIGPEMAALRRGAVVVFRRSDPPGEEYVKRVAAKGGDSIEIDATGVVVNGQRLRNGDCADNKRQDACRAETSVDAVSYEVVPDGGRSPPMRLVVPDGHLFVLGDNRPDSFDSRQFGTIPRKQVVAVAKSIWFSKEWTRVGIRFGEQADSR